MKEIYLVTGGAGFIGSNIVEHLLRDNNRVRVVDNLSTGRKENLDFVKGIELKEGQFEFLDGDIRDLDVCRRATKGVDFVLHQAALPSVARSLEDPIATNEVNVKGTLNLLWASKKAGIKKFVYASSSSVYGDSPTLPKREEMKPNPFSPYAVSKLTGEYYCNSFFTLYGLETVALRYFNVFGPRQDPTSQYSAVVPRFIKSVIAGERPVIFGDGEQSRDFTYVENVIKANILAARTERIPNRVFNIACGERTSIKQLLREINSIVRSDITPVFKERRAGDVKAPVFKERRAGDVRHSLADIEKAGADLKFFPEFFLRDGLIRTVQGYK
ncbi:MAG: SDR family oxidoreductase [Thermodesulfobacteriota bacterium]